jgi:cysteine sulfinate desulfinase/cysteine desulfurase-like protein
MGLNETRARSVIRLSFGPDATEEDATAFVTALKASLVRKP